MEASRGPGNFFNLSPRIYSTTKYNTTIPTKIEEIEIMLSDYCTKKGVQDQDITGGRSGSLAGIDVRTIEAKAACESSAVLKWNTCIGVENVSQSVEEVQTRRYSPPCRAASFIPQEDGRMILSCLSNSKQFYVGKACSIACSQESCGGGSNFF